MCVYVCVCGVCGVCVVCVCAQYVRRSLDEVFRAVCRNLGRTGVFYERRGVVQAASGGALEDIIFYKEGSNFKGARLTQGGGRIDTRGGGARLTQGGANAPILPPEIQIHPWVWQIVSTYE